MIFALTACGTNTAPTPGPDADKPSDEKIVIRLGFSTEPDSHYGKGSAEFERLVEEYTNGKVDVQLFPSATLGNERDMIEGISLGTLEMCLSSTGPMPNFSKEFQVFDLPFIITDKDRAYEVMDGETGQQILASLEPLNIKGLGFWEKGFRKISNSKREIVHPTDMAGIKFLELCLHQWPFLNYLRLFSKEL